MKLIQLVRSSASFTFYIDATHVHAHDSLNFVLLLLEERGRRARSDERRHPDSFWAGSGSEIEIEYREHSPDVAWPASAAGSKNFFFLFFFATRDKRTLDCETQIYQEQL